SSRSVGEPIYSYSATANSIPDPKANRNLPGGDNQPVERKPDRPGALSGSVSARVRPGMRHFLRHPPDCRVHHDWLAEEAVHSEPVSWKVIPCLSGNKQGR